MIHSIDVLKDALKTEQRFVEIKEEEIKKHQERIHFAVEQLSDSECKINNIKDAIFKLGGSIDAVSESQI